MTQRYKNVYSLWGCLQSIILSWPQVWDLVDQFLLSAWSSLWLTTSTHKTLSGVGGRVHGASNGEFISQWYSVSLYVCILWFLYPVYHWWMFGLISLFLYTSSITILFISSEMSYCISTMCFLGIFLKIEWRMMMY